MSGVFQVSGNPLHIVYNLKR